MNKINKNFKKSNVSMNDDFDIYQLERKSNHLLDCSISKTLDEVSFSFTYGDENFFDDIKELSLSSKYRALINIKYLLEDINRVKFSLDPSNLMYDLNLMPKIIMRDIYEDDLGMKNDFLTQYKSLIGYVLQNKYQFNDYYDGGLQLLSKNKVTAPYKDIESVADIVTTLNGAYEKLQTTLKTTLIEVDKKKYRNLKIFNRVISIFLVASLATGIFFGFYKLNESKTFNAANEAFIKQDYITVVETLNNTKVGQMNGNTKYILAVSNIKIESLTEEQKSNILSSVSLNADTRILEFWIYLGKNETEESIDIAKQLGNKEYIAYGYMTLKSQVENNSSLTGAEREEKLKEIESSLKELNINTDDDATNNTK